MDEENLQIKTEATLDLEKFKKSMLDLIDEAGKLKNESNKTNKSMQEETEKTSGMFGKLGETIGNTSLMLRTMAQLEITKNIISGLKMATEAVIEFRDAADDQQDAVDGVNLQLKNMGIYTTDLSDKIQDYAKEMEELTNFSDQQVLEADKMLLTFRGIGEEALPTATSAMLDMSAVMKQDLQSSAMQLGKSLSDPIEGVTALRRVGVMLSDQQEAEIKLLVQQNDLYGAQKIILNELNTEFGGQAQLQKDALDQLKNAWTSFKEVLGSFVQPAVDGVAEAMTGAIKETENLIATQKKVDDAMKEQTGFEVMRKIYTDLREKINLTDAETKLYHDTINKMKELYPELLGNLDLEKGKYEDIAKALSDVNVQLENKFLFAMKEKEMSNIEKQLAKEKINEYETIKKLKKEEVDLDNYIASNTTISIGKNGERTVESPDLNSEETPKEIKLTMIYIEKYKNEIEKIREKQETLKNNMKEINQKYVDIIGINQSGLKEGSYIKPTGNAASTGTESGTRKEEKIEDNRTFVMEPNYQIIRNSKYEEELFNQGVDKAKKESEEERKRLKKEDLNYEDTFDISNVPEAETALNDINNEIEKEKLIKVKETAKVSYDPMQYYGAEHDQYLNDAIASANEVIDYSKKFEAEQNALNYKKSIMDEEERMSKVHYEELQKIADKNFDYDRINHLRIAEEGKKYLIERTLQASQEKAIEEMKTNFQQKSMNLAKSMTDKLILSGKLGAVEMREMAKQQLKDYLVTEGQKFAFEALKNGALALGALATGNMAQATAFGLASAEDAAVAAAAGVAAQAINMNPTTTEEENKTTNNYLGTSVIETESKNEVKELVIHTNKAAIIRELIPELWNALDDGYVIRGVGG